MNEALVLSGMEQVRYCANRIHKRMPNTVELDDLMSAGYVGLVQAAAKFKPEKGLQFSTYAQHKINGAILDYLRSLDWGPRGLRRRGRALLLAEQQATRRLGRTPETDEVAATAQMEVADYHKLTSEVDGLKFGSLYRETDTSDTELVQVADTRETPFESVMKQRVTKELTAVLERLPSTEQLVLKLYYYEDMTMNEIAELLGVVESRVSQVHVSALRGMQRLMGVDISVLELRRYLE